MSSHRASGPSTRRRSGCASCGRPLGTRGTCIRAVAWASPPKNTAPRSSRHALPTSAASLSVKAVRAAANCWRKSSTSVTDAGEWSEAVVDAGAGPCEPPGLVLASAAKGVTLMPMMVKCVSVSAHQLIILAAYQGISVSGYRPAIHRARPASIGAHQWAGLFELVAANPDLYGPFWVSTTLIFAMWLSVMIRL